jgi:protein-S-isoprenylcysteine O-methyltransferase Ste14
MIESIVVTVPPVLFLIVLFGGESLFKRRNIDQGGEAPIDRRLFVCSKYLIPIVWGTAVLHGWGIGLFFGERLPMLKAVALCLWVLGFTIMFIGRLGLGDSFRIGSPKEATRLRADGLFRLSRNPMYVGVFATLLAASVYTLNPILLLAGIFIVAVHHRIVLAEEEHLRRSFGEKYVDYCRRVRRYL